MKSDPRGHCGRGRYDKNALSQVVDATIITLGGFAVFNDRGEAGLSRLAEQRGSSC